MFKRNTYRNRWRYNQKCSIASLVKGMRIQDVIDKTEGISCNGRGTSCPDQLSKALKELLASKNV